jgi:uncharacterized membrane-anchored protein
MNTTITRALIVLGALLVLGGVNYSIAHKEGIKHSGEIIYMDLAPVDPRSLMQGDYMTLNFAVARQIDNSFTQPDTTDAAGIVRPGTNDRPLEGENRTVNITLDEKRIARLSTTPIASASGLKLRYRIRKGSVWLGTNGFFFEEGRAEQYAKARYGEFRLDHSSGEAVLVGLRDEKLQAL